jgi:hypothetical protein
VRTIQRIIDYGKTPKFGPGDELPNMSSVISTDGDVCLTLVPRQSDGSGNVIFVERQDEAFPTVGYELHAFREPESLTTALVRSRRLVDCVQTAIGEYELHFEGEDTSGQQVIETARFARQGKSAFPTYLERRMWALNSQLLYKVTDSQNCDGELIPTRIVVGERISGSITVKEWIAENLRPYGEALSGDFEVRLDAETEIKGVNNTPPPGAHKRLDPRFINIGRPKPTD